MFENSQYSLSRRVKGSFAEVVDATRAALAKEGFGVLTEIDVKATLAKKLDVTTRPYVILGACNPALAHRALQLDPAIGTLLPCNVVVAENESGGVEVATIDPKAMFSVVDRIDVAPIVEEVRARLERVLEGLTQ
jgi:uncharacterized protein (DUF302 family)